VWDVLFGSDVGVVEWDQFIHGLGTQRNVALTIEEINQLKTIIDYSNAGSVTCFRFLEFLKGFGPLSESVENVKRVLSAEWFYGFISSAEAKMFLEGQPISTYLIRFSGSRPGAFTLDVVRDTGQVRSVRLNRNLNGGFSALIEGQNKERIFKSLHEIVDTYNKMGLLKYPFSSKHPHSPWFHGDLTREEAEQLLKGHIAGTFLIRFQ